MAKLLIVYFCLLAALSCQAYAAEPNVETIARGLQTPWAIAFAPDGRIFVSERPGFIRVIEKGALAPEPWMRLDAVETGESGDAKDPRKTAAFENYFKGRYGRLRDIVEGPDRALYLLTSNRDGRGRPGPEDDRVLRIIFK
jgi:glucose/arabinose dehydrogenase